ncbi:MAG: histidine kinase [Pseudomonadota bacterium]
MESQARIFAGPRVRFTLAVAMAIGLLLGLSNGTPLLLVLLRVCFVAMALLLAFGLFERWPKRLPKWLPRTIFRLIGMGLFTPIAAGLACGITGGTNAGLAEGENAVGPIKLVFTSLVFAPWIAVGAILRQRDATVREQAFAFELERSQMEKQVSEARLRLLQAQVEPHFLFNTLANVQALVDSGSPQASKVLSNLIAYLRAAVPRMQSQTRATLADEVDLVRAYLELMQMRMPDRLQFGIHLDPAAARLQCPPMTLLTLVENAVRHGIDPSETGGRIDTDIWIRDDRCVLRVQDTGVGLKQSSGGLGTGLTTLRERLKLAFGGGAHLAVTEIAPHGVCAEIVFPVREAA